MIRLSEQHDLPTHATVPPVAIVGIGCIFPKSGNVREFWRLTRRGEDAVGPVPETHWRAAEYFDADPKKPDMTYCTRGAFVEPVAFDPTEWGIPPNALEATDTAQLLALVASKMALHDAGYHADPPRSPAPDAVAPLRALDRARTGVILGVTGTLELALPLAARLGHPHWRRALKDAGVDERTAEQVVQRIADAYVPWQENSFPGLLGNVVAGRIANRLDLRGTNCVVDAACASSLSALHLAMLELQTGRADVMLSGGVDTLNDIFMFMCFSKTPALSPSGDARPFSDDADGTVIGEGVGVLVLKRLDDAERDGDRIYAVIRGIGSSSDGRSESIYAPRSAGQAAALRHAYAAAGVEPSTVELLEAHGTGTKVGDVVEVEALRSVFGQPAGGEPTCALGSVKSQIGHTKAAAGVAGLIKATLALYHRVLPASIKLRQPNPKLELAGSAFYLNSELRPWPASRAHPRRAGVSAFGFGGSNFHVVLEEHATDSARPRSVSRTRPRGAEHAPPRSAAWDGSVQIVALSADERHELSLRLDAFAQEALAANRAQLACLAAELRRAFRPDAAWRLVMVVHPGNTVAELIERARRLFAGAAAGERPADVYLESGPAGKLAFLFPGQGSQYCGMGRDLVAVFPEMLDALSEFEHVATPGVARSPVVGAIFPRPAFTDEQRAARDAALTDTRAAQPALGAISAAMLRVLRRFGVEPDTFAGHSFGELPALYAAGRIDLNILARLARVRGQLMAQADAGRGAMSAIAGPIDTVEDVLCGGEVVVANRNSPTQVVISGEREQVAVAEARLRQRGFTVRRLQVGGAFHSPMVADALGAFQRELASAPLPAGQPVISCTTGEAYPADAAAARELLGEQLKRPVDFIAQVRTLIRTGVRTLVEVGPRSVLTSLVRAGQPSAVLRLLALDASAGRDGMLDLARALAQIAAAGHPIRLDAWDPSPPEVRKPGMIVPLVGANYRAPRRVASSTAQLAPIAAAAARAPSPAAAAPPVPARPREVVAAPPHPADRAVASAPRPATPKVEDHQQGPSERNRRIAVNANHPDGNGQPVRSAVTDDTPIAQAGAPPGLLADAFRVVSEGVRAMQALQQQTAALHRRFIEGQEMAHKTIQHLIESQHHLVERALRTLPVASLAGSLAFGGANPLPPPTHGDGVAGAPADSSASRHWIAPPSTVPAPRPFVPSAPAMLPPTANDNGIEATLLQIVARKTGMPLDQTALDLHLEHDLGIDAVTRGEILAELRYSHPDMPPLASTQAAAIATLRELGARLRTPTSAATPPVRPPVSRVDARPAAGIRPPDPAPPPRDPPASVTAGSARHAESGNGADTALLGVVAELTGYPVEMLNVDMDMEADLGIDSIKRVEILATLEQRMPDFPGVNPEYMGSLRTLRQILEYVDVARGNGSGENGANGANGKEVASRLPKFDPQPAPPAADSDHRATLDTLVAAGSSLARWQTVVERETWPGAPLKLAADSEIWITDDDAPLAAALAEQLSRRGVAVRLVRLAEPPTDASHVGGLLIVAPAEPRWLGLGDASADRWLKSAFRIVQQTAAALRSAAGRGGALLATVSRMDAAFGLIDAAAAGAGGGLAGLVKTASCEWPEVACRAFDVAHDWRDTRALADAIVARLGQGGPIELGLDAHGARRVDVRPAPLNASDFALHSPLLPGDVVVVTGGARGVTAEAAVALAQAVQPMLVLLGRSPEPQDEPACLHALTQDADIKRALADEDRRCGRVPTPAGVQAASRRWLANREIAASLTRIRVTGATAEYHQVDLRDAHALHDVLVDVAARLGPVRGLIHGAGVLHDRRIEDKSTEQFEAVFDTKVAGLRNVLAALSRNELRTVVLFSSVSGRFGRRGQVDYAMANEVLNKAAQRLASELPRCRVRSINWGPWDGGMVGPSLRREFERDGVGVIPPAAGAAALLAELFTTEDHSVEVVRAAGELGTAWAAARQSPPRDEPLVAAGGEGPRPAAAHASPTRRVDVHTHPFLKSHVLAGRPVLPLAISAEWLAHAAVEAHPGAHAVAIRQLRALRPVAIGPEGLSLVAQPHDDSAADDSNILTRVELLGAHGERFASAEVLLSCKTVDSPLGAAPPAPPAGRALDPTAVYRDILFHGAELQALRDPIRVDPQGISAAVVAAPHPARWMTAPHREEWLFDPLLLDSLLQLGIVWCHEQRGVLCLPSLVAEYRQARTLPARDLTATLFITKATGQQIVADGLLHTRQAVHARLKGCVWTIDPRLAAAFNRATPRLHAGA